MLNQIVLVGRLARDLEIKELENGGKVCEITLAVPRSFKNLEGVYETDFIPCTLLGSVASNTAEYCRKGDLIGVKGRVQRKGNDYTANSFPILELVAEKVTFLSSTHKED